MGQFQDLTGQQFGDIFVNSYNKESSIDKKCSMWNCKCVKCGHVSIKSIQQLKRIIKLNSSGCPNCNGYWLVGSKFGRWTVLERGQDRKYPKGNKKIVWKCRCDCGTIGEVTTRDLITGHSKSCGCFKNEKTAARNKEKGKWNGDSGKEEYSLLFTIWNNMRLRCEYASHPSYYRYGGRGIKVCSEWQDWFIFKEWALTHGYEKGLSIDRIDIDKGYTPSNCRWVTRKEQANNTSINHYIAYKNKTQTLMQWCEELNLNYRTIKSRIDNYNYTVEEAFELGKGGKDPRKNKQLTSK